MAKVVEGHEVSVLIEEYGRALSVRQEAIDVLRGEGNRQADEWLRAAVKAWEDCDVSDLDEIKDVQFKLGCAADAVSALVALAPAITDEDEVLGE
jgi:hypothetical protein